MFSTAAVMHPKVKNTIYTNRNLKERCLKETTANKLTTQKHGRTTHVWSQEGDNTLYFCCRRSLANTSGMRLTCPINAVRLSSRALPFMLARRLTPAMVARAFLAV